MIVATALDAVVSEANASDTAEILWKLEKRLVSTLNVADGERDEVDIKDGADLAILFIRKDGEITLSSAKLHVFVCDGVNVQNMKGQKLSIGDGTLESKTKIKKITIPACKDNSYYIVSDGLFEQVGGKSGIPFGYNRFQQIILECHGRPEAEVTGKIWNVFESYMGSEDRRDDVTLVSFKL